MSSPFGVSSVNSVFTYFNPSKSPYYTIGIASCVGLWWACDIEDQNYWLWISIPALVVAALTLALSFDTGNNLSKEEHTDQLRFARSTCISAAVVVLSFAGKAIATGQPVRVFVFDINESICCFQILLFLVYSWALNKYDLLGAERNYVQITLLTSAFLIDTSLNLSQATDPKDVGSKHHLVAAFELGALWIICMIVWLIKLFKLGIFRRPDPPPFVDPKPKPI
jgi:hypothetical protein